MSLWKVSSFGALVLKVNVTSCVLALQRPSSRLHPESTGQGSHKKEPVPINLKAGNAVGSDLVGMIGFEVLLQKLLFGILLPLLEFLF